MYKYCISLTQQFRFCGNSFKLDTYRGCDFNCEYCFANSRKGYFKKKFDIADFEYLENIFKKSFDIDKKYNNLTIELLRKKVPLHVGGMSDPFQNREKHYKITKRLIELSNKYKYPLIFSTKGICDYFDILNKEIHAFQISLVSFDNKFEKNTPNYETRKDFIKILHKKGFWISLRLQPLIFVDEAIAIIKDLEKYINYISIEHLKLPMDNIENRILFKDIILKNKYVAPVHGRMYELNYLKKKENILKIKNITNIKIGVADNELHELSDSNCC